MPIDMFSKTNKKFLSAYRRECSLGSIADIPRMTTIFILNQMVSDSLVEEATRYRNIYGLRSIKSDFNHAFNRFQFTKATELEGIFSESVEELRAQLNNEYSTALSVRVIISECSCKNLKSAFEICAIRNN